MYKSLNAHFIAGMLTALTIVFFPLTGLGYTQGDINNDDKIGLQETIYSLKVVAGQLIATSGNVINVPADVATIQQAIDAAVNGDTINIAAGTYNESLEVTDKSLILTGAGKGQTIIDSQGADAVTVVHSPGFLIQSLTIQNGDDGIHVSNNSKAEINDVIVTGCTNNGVSIDGNSNGKLAGSTIDDNGGHGIRVAINSNLYITGNITTQNNTKHGLNIFSGAVVLVDESTFASTANDNRGISLAFTASLFIEASSVSLQSNGGEGLKAVMNSVVGSMGNASILAESNGSKGIQVFASSSFYAGGSVTVRGSSSNGISVGGSSSIELGGTVLIENCTSNGIGISNSSTASIYGQTTIQNCVDSGIYASLGSSLYSGDTASITVQNITGEGTGIAVWNNSVFRGRGGTFNINNNVVGIEGGRNSTVELRDKGAGLTATVSSNERGIVLWQDSVLRTDDGLTISGNTSDGISVSNGGYVQLRQAVIQNNGRWGIDVNDGTGLNIANSTIQNNGTGGSQNIYIGFGSRSTLSGNTLGSALICDLTAISRGDAVCP